MSRAMLAYKNAVDVTYSHAEQMSTLVEAAGKRWNRISFSSHSITSTEKIQNPFFFFFLHRSPFNLCLDFSLRCSGRVCYLGWGSLAVLGLIDASECNPTFGAGETCTFTTTNAPHSLKKNLPFPVFVSGRLWRHPRLHRWRIRRAAQQRGSSHFSGKEQKRQQLKERTVISHLAAPSSLWPTLKFPIKVLLFLLCLGKGLNCLRSC